MERLQDLSTVLLTLRDGIVKGYWTLEDLDTPPPGFLGDHHRNLLRDGEPQERVEARPSPRDFIPGELLTGAIGATAPADHDPFPDFDI